MLRASRRISMLMLLHQSFTRNVGAMMQIQPTFEVVEVGGRGKVVRATQDLLPGLDLFRELPLLHVTKEYLKHFIDMNDATNSAFAVPLAVYNTFQKLPEDKKKRYLKLFGPISGTFPRLTSLSSVTGKSREMTDEELTTAIQVISILKYNVFGNSEIGPLMVYELCTRISHSCYPNCFMDTEGDYHVCRTVRPIAAGEELTICYKELYSDKPTHFRRQKYLTDKDFTCHCPRCDALGDDTRQFSCFTAASSTEAQCPGVHMMCQPLNKEKVLVGLVVYLGVDGTIEGTTEAHYTGVDYVEPYLLPCTVCGRSPPTKYQQEMFALEPRLPSINADFVQRYNTLTTSHGMLSRPQQFKIWQTFLHDLTAMGFPPRHMLSKELLRIIVIVTSHIIKQDPNPDNLHKNKEAHKRAVLEYVELISSLNITEMPIEALQFAAVEVTEIMPTDEELLLGLGYIQRAVRMNSLLNGRVLNRHVECEAILCDILEKLEARQALPTANLSLDQCHFCGESPQHAAIKLMCCAQCLQVAYCSPGCQKAHWKKLHSKTCSGL